MEGPAWGFGSSWTCDFGLPGLGKVSSMSAGTIRSKQLFNPELPKNSYEGRTLYQYKRPCIALEYKFSVERFWKFFVRVVPYTMKPKVFAGGWREKGLGFKVFKKKSLNNPVTPPFKGVRGLYAGLLLRNLN